MLGVGLENVIIAVALGVVPAVVRLVRAGTLSIRRRTFVDAARGLGASNRTIILHHVLPNALPPVIVQATLGLGATLLTAAGLGFLGLGVQQPTPEWGAMLGEGRQYIFSNPNVATFPGHRHLPDRARLQPRRRWPARRARPATQSLSSRNRPEPTRPQPATIDIAVIDSLHRTRR